MGSLSGLEIGFIFVFGVILIGFVAEVYYFLYWKRRLSNGEINDESNKYTPLLSYFFCWKTPTTNLSSSKKELNSTVSRNRETSEINQEQEEDLELGTTNRSTDSLLKGGEEESVDLELMRVHNLWGPPRFLFTINEETKEDLESDVDAKSRKGSRTRSLSHDINVVFAAATANANDTTPFLTPLASPIIKSSLLDGCYNINPLFESFTESDLIKLRSSPPPKFKFLRDAEDKLIKRLVEESERRKSIKDQDSGFKSNPSSFHSSGPSKVIPLASSPSN